MSDTMFYILEHADARRPQSRCGSNNRIRVLGDVEDGWYNPYGTNNRHHNAALGPGAQYALLLMLDPNSVLG